MLEKKQLFLPCASWSVLSFSVVLAINCRLHRPAGWNLLGAALAGAFLAPSAGRASFHQNPSGHRSRRRLYGPHIFTRQPTTVSARAIAMIGGLIIVPLVSLITRNEERFRKILTHDNPRTTSPEKRTEWNGMEMELEISHFISNEWNGIWPNGNKWK